MADGYIRSVYTFHATMHERKQPNLAFAHEVDNVFDTLEIVARLRGVGYRTVRTKLVGRNHYRYVRTHEGRGVEKTQTESCA